MEKGLQDVRDLMASGLSSTVLLHLLPTCKSLMANGKMLRARLCLRVGPSAGVPRDTLVTASAAVEMIHAASLLHDDVIDGGMIRRGLPTFWVERGVPGAILVGDLMLFKALDLVAHVDESRLVRKLIEMTGEVCDAESEQELLIRGQPADWETCVRIARRKTGALFAFAAFCCGGRDEALSNALCEAGYAIGTAYQLADDVLDVRGTEASAGKTLGTDRERAKNTTATVKQPVHDANGYIETLCDKAERLLANWPHVQQAWRTFITLDMRPALVKNLTLAAG
ncbi:MAG TPA: polyprenyl synthetase family protein [Kiritimatiellia bacterium]